jgi:hypothetical protein
MIRTELEKAGKQRSQRAPDTTFFMEIFGALLILTLAIGGMLFALL